MKRQVITMQKSKNLSIDEAFSNFIKKSKIRNLSDETLKTYHNHYKVFSELIDNTTPIADVTSDTLDDFIVYLREKRKVTDVTVNTYLRTLRAYLYYCMDCGYLKAFKIKMPKVEKKIKETYTNDELEGILFLSGVFWKYITPLYRNTTSDPWDIAAYMFGELLYWVIIKIWTKNMTNGFGNS